MGEVLHATEPPDLPERRQGIGHLGVNGFGFYDAAKKLPGYDKLKYENAVRDLTTYAKREQGQYELTAQARKVLRPVIGPAPDAADYESWWRGRLVSVRMMRDEGVKVEWATEPPVPLAGEKTARPAKKPARKEPKKKPARKKG